MATTKTAKTKEPAPAPVPPTRTKMRRGGAAAAATKVHIRLTPAEVAELDDLAARLGADRSTVARMLLRAGLRVGLRDLLPGGTP